MKRSTKIIQISGFRGIITAIFIVICLCAGFVVFPGHIAMKIWNHFAGYSLPYIDLYQGVLLWAIFALTCFIANKQSFAVTMESAKELNDDELNTLMERVRMQSQARKINQLMLKNLEEIKKEEVLEDNSETETKKDIVNK